MSSVYPNQRRRDPQPLGRAGETALVAVCAVLLAVSLAALVGLGAACLVAGGGWVWPHGSTAITHTLGGLIAGHPGRGLPAVLARRVPGRVAVYSGVVVAELLLAARRRRRGSGVHPLAPPRRRPRRDGHASRSRGCAGGGPLAQRDGHHPTGPLRHHAFSVQANARRADLSERRP